LDVPVAEVAVYGTAAADVVLRVPALPRPGDHIWAEPLGWRLGGASANLACGLASAGHHVRLVGPVGTDAMAEALVAELKRRGVRTDRLIRLDVPAPRALILLDPDGERTILVIDREFEANAFPIDNPPDVDSVDCVYVESYERFSTLVAERSPSALVVAAPPSDGRRHWPADIIVGSERQYPAAWLAAPFEAARPVAGSRLRWVVVTRGRRGADAYGRDGSFHIDARPAEQVDATGAGDAFAAGLIAGLLVQHGIKEAMELGASKGAAAVELLQSVPPDWLAGIDLT
jgi:sugar/nucleoside kinase (ribokinase family)